MLRICYFLLLTISSLFIETLGAAEMKLPKELLRVSEKLNQPLTEKVLLVSSKEQRLYLYEDQHLVASYVVSTAEAGVGQEEKSYQTPLGLHKVAKKIGRNAPLYTIFRGRINTGKRWNPHEFKYAQDDLVLTRILWLEGLEPGYNSGRNSQGILVDSKDRFIYIHGTNHEEDLGVPASKGCIRMAANNLIYLFDQVPVGSLVWIY